MRKPNIEDKVNRALDESESQRLKNLPKRTVTVSGRMNEQDRDALRRYFADELGVSLSTGVSIALKEYMKRHGIH
jgi:hypothetical protein